jgi:hypothetical protein
VVLGRRPVCDSDRSVPGVVGASGIRSTGDGFNISLDPKILVLASPSLKFKSFIV